MDKKFLSDLGNDKMLKTYRYTTNKNWKVSVVDLLNVLIYSNNVKVYPIVVTPTLKVRSLKPVRRLSLTFTHLFMNDSYRKKKKLLCAWTQFSLKYYHGTKKVTFYSQRRYEYRRSFWSWGYQKKLSRIAVLRIYMLRRYSMWRQCRR